MEIKPTLARITIYPVKSLDGVDLQKAMITNGGCILHDREYAISDTEGNFIIGKSNPLVHLLRSSIDFENETISLRHEKEEKWNDFHLVKEKKEIESFLTDFFTTPCVFNQNSEGRFLDIPDISGVTTLSTASLQSVSEWFNLDLVETRKRFRATIEIKGVPAFWEDNLFSKEGIGIEYKIGDVTLFGMSPRARCVVPTRHPESGEVLHAFPKSFAKKRAETLPEWSHLSEHGHHYYLSVDCYIPASEVGKWIKVGDEVTVIGEKKFY